MREFGLMLVAIILATLILPIAFCVGLVAFRKKLGQYFYAIAIGIDQLGGSVLYGQPDWTVSSWTYYKRNDGVFYMCFMRVIDFFFGKDHCKESFYSEIDTTRRMLEEVNHAN